MRIAFLGHLSVDINVVGGVEHVQYGGGVMHGSVTAQRLGAEVTLTTKCAETDRPHFSFVAEAGIRVVFLPSARSTSIRNDYPSANPDDRTSRLLSRAEPFSARDLEGVQAEVLHVNPLTLGEFPPELLPLAREKAGLLAADAQGFLRAVLEDGRMQHRDWPQKDRYLPLLDLLKVDVREAEVLTGSADPRQAASKLRGMGPRSVLLTHQGGLCVCDAAGLYEAPFRSFTLEGRTGRGDTCTAAFLVARLRSSAAEATEFAARVTSDKMQYQGPYRGA